MMRFQSDESPRFAKPRWAVFRMILGWLQMVGATAAFMLFLQSGMTRAAVIVVLVTGLLTLLSLALFRRR